MAQTRNVIDAPFALRSIFFAADIHNGNQRYVVENPVPQVTSLTTGLFKVISDHAPHAIQNVEFKTLQGRKVAIVCARS